MLLIIGAIGLLVIIGACRKPEIKFFSVVTIFNRKEKLTERGAKIYVFFFALLIVGILFKFIGNHSTSGSQAIAGGDVKEISSNDTPSKISQDDNESENLKNLTHIYERSTETIASQIPENGMADSALQQCNDRVENGMMLRKQGKGDSALSVDVSACMHIARDLCHTNGSGSSEACKEFLREPFVY